jgi:thioredoxin 1
MATVALTKDTFKDAVDKGGILLVDWWAEWCGPCRAFAPVYERASDKHPDAVFAKIDTEAERELAAAFQIQSIPTLMIFRDRVLLFAQPGALPEPALEELIGKVEALDMDAVRRQIAEQQAQAPQA